MKTELQPIIKKRGIMNNDMFNLIAMHNEGKCTYTLNEIHSYCKGKICEYPNTLENSTFSHLSNELIIMENGKDITLIIKETHVEDNKEDTIS